MEKHPPKFNLQLKAMPVSSDSDGRGVKTSAKNNRSANNMAINSQQFHLPARRKRIVVMS